MDTLLYFIVFAGLFFLMMRFGCGSHVMGHAHGDHEAHGGDGAGAPGNASDAHETPPETGVDPVCGMTVRTDSAKSAVYAGRVYYFCSAEHREQFEARSARQMEGSHG